MDLDKYYTFSYKNYKGYGSDKYTLLDILNDNTNDVSLRIYHNKKLFYRCIIFHNKITNIYKGNGDYIKFNIINIKKELLQNSLYLLDRDDELNNRLFLEILKRQLELNIQ